MIRSPIRTLTPEDFPLIFKLPSPRKQEIIRTMGTEMQTLYVTWETEEKHRQLKIQQEKFRAKEAREDANAISVYSKHTERFTPQFNVLPAGTDARTRANISTYTPPEITVTLASEESSDTPSPIKPESNRLAP
tara:strand:- start:9653 stop:10054 length:402 start_codon:yes stop_codon:yes gene_type:complete